MKKIPIARSILWLCLVVIGFILAGSAGLALIALTFICVTGFEYWSQRQAQQGAAVNSHTLGAVTGNPNFFDAIKLTEDKITDQLDLINNESVQTRNLINEAVHDLNESFSHLSQTTANQQSLLESSFRGHNSNTIHDFVKETEELLGYFVNSVISTSKDSVYLMHCIDDMGERIQSVLGLLEGIKNIAADINLLSLNASIEAARAGDAGRGFSVVAQEVRNLSNKSDQVSNDINSLSKDVITTLNTVKDVVNRIASADMSVAIKSKEQVIQMSEFVREQSDHTQVVLNQTSQQAQEIAMATNQAIVSLQFEDMSRQLLEHIEKRVSALHELMDIMSSSITTINTDNPAFDGNLNAKIQHIEESLAKIKPRIASTEHKSVSQTNMDAGDIELF